MGQTYEISGDFLAGEIWYKQAISFRPDRADSHVALGALLELSGRLDEAEAALRRATRCENGASDEAWFRLGRVLRARHEFVEAAACVERALAINPGYKAASEVLADLRAAMERSKQRLGLSNADDLLSEMWDNDRPANNVVLARSYLRRFEDSDPVWCRLGHELTSLCRHDEARAALWISIRLGEAGEKPSWIARSWMGKSYMKAGDFPSAEVWYRRAIDAAPNNAGPHIFLGALLAKWGRFDEAKAAHCRGTSCTEGLPEEAWYNLGLILRAEERFAEAAECFERALSIDPGYALPPKALADVRSAIQWQRQESHGR
jgi:tetratricopeptide (TPR) repeat protein